MSRMKLLASVAVAFSLSPFALAMLGLLFGPGNLRHEGRTRDRVHWQLPVVVSQVWPDPQS